MASIYRGIILLLFASNVYGQQFPFNEKFDSLSPPAMPTGWTTSTMRAQSGDFTTTGSSPLSTPNAILSTNATINQWLATPTFNFINVLAESIFFYERRSASHNAGFLLEASLDHGKHFSIQISDTLANPGTTSYVLRAFRLPSILSNQQAVVFRWNVVGNGTGTTGTLRLDNISMTGKYQYDGGVFRMFFEPDKPTVIDSVDLLVTIKNFGLSPLDNASVNIYEDRNNDSLPESSEQILTTAMSETLLAGDTTRVRMPLGLFAEGEQTIIVKTLFPNDQNAANDITHAVLSIGLRTNSVVINEIMYAPRSPQPEWVELAVTKSDSINLRHWKISDQNTGTQYSISAGDLWIKKGEYSIVTKDTIAFSLFHPGIRNKFQISALPASLWNNGGDAVVLFDDRGAVMDSVRYNPAWGGNDSISLERMLFTKSSNDSDNWGPSQDSSGCTPGKQNYLTPLEYDIRIARVSSQTIPDGGASILVSLTNTGLQSAVQYSTSLYFDRNNDSIPVLDEMITTQAFHNDFLPKDTVTVTFNWDHHPSGIIPIICTVTFAQDMRISDNFSRLLVKLPFPERSIVINEVMYQPINGKSEYVELFNNSEGSIDLKEWRLAEKRDTGNASPSHRLSESSYMIAPGEFIVIAQDSSLIIDYPYLADSTVYHFIIQKNSLGLKNEGEDIVLTDLAGNVIDSVQYSPAWHSTEIDDLSGRSLERIQPRLPTNDRRNWNTCVDSRGGTPGNTNSIHATRAITVSSISCLPNPFSPDGDGYDDFTIVGYSVTSLTATIHIRIFDSKGRLVRTLVNHEASGPRGEFIWDGYSDNHDRSRIGIYIVLLEAYDSEGKHIESTKGTIVVATRL